MAALCIIFSLIWFPTFTSTSKPCNSNPSEYGFALLDQVYKSFLADRLVSCYISCNMQSACQSLNYNLADKTCELNNDTKCHLSGSFNVQTCLKHVKELFLRTGNKKRPSTTNSLEKQAQVSSHVTLRHEQNRKRMNGSHTGP